MNVQTTKLAHSVNNVDQVPISINAHEVRSIASTWAWSNNVPLDDVVKTGFWSSENSFIMFYLRDISVLESSIGLIGPVVACHYLYVVDYQFSCIYVNIGIAKLVFFQLSKRVYKWQSSDTMKFVFAGVRLEA